MNPYIERIHVLLSKHTPDFGYEDAHSLLEMLYIFYTEQNPIDSTAIRNVSNEIGTYMRKLTLDEENKVFDLFYDLCVQYEQTAFLEGMQVGIRLMIEAFNE